MGADLILNTNHRKFIEFLFEVLYAARESLENPEFLDNDKNMFYSSRFTSSRQINDVRGSHRQVRRSNHSSMRNVQNKKIDLNRLET